MKPNKWHKWHKNLCGRRGHSDYVSFRRAVKRQWFKLFDASSTLFFSTYPDYYKTLLTTSLTNSHIWPRSLTLSHYTLPLSIAPIYVVALLTSHSWLLQPHSPFSSFLFFNLTLHSNAQWSEMPCPYSLTIFTSYKYFSISLHQCNTLNFWNPCELGARIDPSSRS